MVRGARGFQVPGAKFPSEGCAKFQVPSSKFKETRNPEPGTAQRNPEHGTAKPNLEQRSGTPYSLPHLVEVKLWM